MNNWSRYLESLCTTYAQWWQIYTITDVVGQKPVEAEPSPFLFDFGLMVQTVEPDRGERGKGEEKVERLTVLEGLRKYASEHVLLVGRPGSGKSTALARLLLEEAGKARTPLNPPLLRGEEDCSTHSFTSDAQESLAPPLLRGAGGVKIPVLVELRYYRTSILDLIQDFLQRHDPKLTVDAETLKSGLRQGQLLLLVDGLNELPSEEARRDLHKLRQDYQKTTPMIFTTRDLGVGGDLDIAKKLEMQPLSETQMQQFIRAYLPQQGEQMLRQLGSRLREFGQTPLLLWMLCSLFRAMEKVPPNLGKVFRQFALSYDCKLKQDIPISGEFRRWCPWLLEQLAWVMTSGEAKTELQVAIPRQKAQVVLTEFLAGKVAHPEDCTLRWLEDLLKHHLIQLGAGDRIEFRHQLIQEYYTAESLLKQLPSLSDDTLKREYLNYLKWTEPLALMLELVDEEAQAVRVVRLALSVDLRLGARLAGAVKSEFQAQTVSLVGRQDIPHPLKLYLFGITRSDSTISGLLEALEDENIVVRRIAAYALDKIGNEAAIPGLLKALGDENIVVRRIAAYALGHIGSEAAIPGLLKALENESYDVCWRAAQTLCKIGSEAAVSGLLRALEHEKINVRWKAAEALGEIGSEAAISGLLKALEDENFDVRWRTAYALGHIGSEAAISGLLKALEDEDSNVRWRAAEALGQIGSEVAIPGLLKALEDKDCNVCGRAAEALGQIGSERAIAGLLQILEDGDYDVHNRAIEALGKISSEATISGLLKAIEDKGFDIHWTDSDALDKSDSDVAVSVLLKAIEDEDYRVRQIAAYALGQIDIDAAFSGLLKAVEDEDYHVRWIAAYVLGQIGTDAAIFGLLKALEDEDYHVCQITAYVLGQIGTGAAISGLLKPMKDESSGVHRRATEAEISGLLEALEDADSSVRRSATYELGKIGSEAAIPGLLTALEDADSDVCRSAAEALGKIGSEAAIPGLLKALEHKDQHVRRIAAEELGQTSTETAIPGLLKALKDADPGVRWSSAEALGEIGSFKLLSPLTQHLQQTGEVDILGAISTLQERCKFYNYTLTQPELIPSMYMLHLSDLHFGTPDQANLWSNQLAADLYNEFNCPRLDALILSGDIANFSTPEEYHAAQQFLDNLRQEFQLQPKQIIMVPGNHDLNWGLAKQAYKLIDREDYQGELKEDQYIKVDENVIRYRDQELYKQRFAHFSTFYETIKGEPYPLEYEQQGILYHLPEQNLLLLGLNSAWQLDDHYKSRASIHMGALTKALSQIRRNRAVYENCLKIAVWHHPLDSDDDDRITDQGFMEQLAVAGFRLFLHGHIHKAETSLYRYDMSADGRKLDRICAGTFGALTKEFMSAYPWQYNLLKLEGDKLTVHTRRREKENGAWKPDARWSQGVGKPLLDYYTICLTPQLSSIK